MRIPFSILLFAIGNNFVFAQETPPITPASNDPNAASVLVLPMKNITGSKNFEYLGTSISDAITESMRSRFVYQQIELSDSLESQFAAIMPDPEVANPAQLHSITKPLKINYFIFGYYKKSETEKNTIEFMTRIYLSGLSKIIEIPTVVNKIDGTIFSATDRVAGQIIEQIVRVNSESPKHYADLATQIEPTNEKIVLTREAVDVDARPSKLGWFVGIGYSWTAAALQDPTQKSTPNPDRVTGSVVAAMVDLMYDFAPEGHNKLMFGSQIFLGGTGQSLTYRGKTTQIGQGVLLVAPAISIAWKYRYKLIHLFTGLGMAFLFPASSWETTTIKGAAPSTIAPLATIGLGINLSTMALEVRYVASRYFGSSTAYAEFDAIVFGLAKRF